MPDAAIITPAILCVSAPAAPQACPAPTLTCVALPRPVERSPQLGTVLLTAAPAVPQEVPPPTPAQPIAYLAWPLFYTRVPNPVSGRIWPRRTR